jgi:hypothetical protein
MLIAVPAVPLLLLCPAGLKKKLKDLMGEFSEMRARIHDENRQVVQRRVYTVTGQHLPEEDIDAMIETGGRSHTWSGLAASLVHCCCSVMCVLCAAVRCAIPSHDNKLNRAVCGSQVCADPSWSGSLNQRTV